MGQLKGAFTGKSIGEIDLNSELGVYSHLKEKIEFSQLYEIALKNEIKDGKAQIYTTLDGTSPQFYDCEIKIRTSNYRSTTQNMIVKITDEELLEITGGIVQGMSGSPIIQNGKLIGAVTHVLIDDCKRGYAIFAENMLETAQGVAEEKLKEAS